MREVTIPATGQRFDLERPGSLAAWNRALNRHYGMEHLRSHSNPFVRRIEARRWARIEALVRKVPFERAVDIGAEDGSLAARWSRHGGRTLLIDLDAAMLKRATLPGAGADAAALPLAANSCDLVVLSALLEHVVDPERVARECARVVRPGGRIVAYVPWDAAVVGLKRWMRRFGIGLGRLHDGMAPGHLRRFDRATFRGIFEPHAHKVSVRLDPFSFGYYLEAEF